ncbi:MAG: hypothetical protein EOP04_22050 [Proteobacteria bacterium]|nr:MAG: hypothetical protein EOP04_22050 [Pseudomonadota bacterium]
MYNHRASAACSGKAFNNLSIAYMIGDGAPKNLVYALANWNVADKLEKQNDAQIEFRSIILMGMTPHQIAQVNAISEAWQLGQTILNEKEAAESFLEAIKKNQMRAFEEAKEKIIPQPQGLISQDDQSKL